MAYRQIHLTGMRFGKLVVLAETRAAAGNRRWLCRCDCGKGVAVFQNALRSGKQTSCGCANRRRPVAKQIAQFKP